MMSTIPVQVRLGSGIVDAIDARASAANITRAEALRVLVEASLSAPQVPEHDPLLVQIGDTLGTLLARADALLEIGKSTHRQARASFVVAHLHALTTLPAAQQDAFVTKLKSKLS